MKRGNLDLEIDRHRGKMMRRHIERSDHVTLQARDCWQMPEAGRVKEVFSARGVRGSMALPTP